jgi:hypothetical protein
MENKPGRGRPRVETRLTPMWKEIILDAGRRGKHITQFLIDLGISFDTHYALLKRNKEYSEAFQEYQKLCEQWWFDKAHSAMEETEGAGFNTRLWQVIMTNKFKDNWKSEKHIDIKTDGEKLNNTNTPIQIEIIRKNITDDENKSSD